MFGAFHIDKIDDDNAPQVAEGSTEGMASAAAKLVARSVSQCLGRRRTPVFTSIAVSASVSSTTRQPPGYARLPRRLQGRIDAEGCQALGTRPGSTRSARGGSTAPR